MTQFFLITLLSLTNWSCKDVPSEIPATNQETTVQHSSDPALMEDNSDAVDITNAISRPVVKESEMSDRQIQPDNVATEESSQVNTTQEPRGNPGEVSQSDKIIKEPSHNLSGDEGSSLTTITSDPSANTSEITKDITDEPSIPEANSNDLEAKPDRLSSEDNKPIVENDGEPLVVASIHDAWNDLLKANVTSKGVVNYGALKRSESKLDDYLALLSKNTPKKSDKSNSAKAFWANAYNAFTVKLILSNYPTSSITNIDGGKPWDTKWINLGGNTYSLNNIEHDILRPIWKDARIHFAVNCAAKSCPPIHNEAFTADRIESQLDKLTKVFINDTKYNQISSSSITVSKIFDWYKEDFGDLVSFIDKYATVAISKGANVSYLDYDWALNGK